MLKVHKSMDEPDDGRAERGLAIGKVTVELLSTGRNYLFIRVEVRFGTVAKSLGAPRARPASPVPVSSVYMLTIRPILTTAPLWSCISNIDLHRWQPEVGFKACM
jgi:hypothetical protein